MATPGGGLLLRSVRVVDVRAGTAGEPSDVRVEGGRITGIDAPSAAPDGPVRWLLPGLIDAHVHLAWDGGADPVEAYRTMEPGAVAARVERHARDALSAGVTSLRDLGGPGWMLGHPRPEAVAAPDILAAGPPVTRVGGHLALFGGEVATPSDARRRVATAIDAGARAIKLVLSGGGLTPGTRPADADLPLEIASAAAAVARAAGIPVAAHCHATGAIRMAIAAGVTTVEHASCVDPDGIARFDPSLATALVDAGMAVVPTAAGALRTAARYRVAGGQSRTDPTAVARLEARAAFTAGWAAAGVTLVAGTDAGVTGTPFDTLPEELVAWVAAGVSPAAAIRGATLDAARCLGLSDRGEVRVGARADLVLLGADPLRDVAALASPLAVIAAGRLTSRDAPGPDRSP